MDPINLYELVEGKQYFADFKEVVYTKSYLYLLT